MSDTAVSTQTDADRELKQKHRAMWASGDYPTLASDLIWELGPRAVAAADVRPRERVLDGTHVGGRHDPRAEVPDEVGSEGRVVARGPHGAVLLLQGAVGFGLRGYCSVGHRSSLLERVG